jgi:hypothetical protein
MMTGICSAASPIAVSCALPYHVAQATTAYVSQNIVTISTSNTDSNAVVTAELLGLDTNGNLINSFVVQNGDLVQLGSKLSPADGKFDRNPHMTQVFAPVPLLHVKLQDKGQTAEAFCSNIPYVEIVQPTGGVVTDSGGGNTNILAAVPLTNPKSLHLYVDGVDLLPQVPGGYLTCTPGAPCAGTATINGNTVGYSNLAINIASSISTLASNTVQATLSDITCGGHLFTVSTAQLPGLPKPGGAVYVDSLSKQATSSVFEIQITDPTPGKITTNVPTPVAGKVCSGTQITGVNINGKNLPVTGETHTAGYAGGVYTVPINTTLDQTDLVRDVFGAHDAPLGTLDAGSNRLAASATDTFGNRTYQNLIFATGSVAPVAIDPNAIVFQNEAVKSTVNSALKNLVKEKMGGALDPPTQTDLQNAFVVGLSASAAQTEYNKLCNAPLQSTNPSINGLTPAQIFGQKVTASIEAISLPVANVSTACTCTAPVNLSIKSVNVGADVSCNLTFNNGSFHVSMGLPDVTVVADANGWCETDAGPVCIDGIAVAVEETATISGITFDFDVTEDNLLNNTTSPPQPLTVPKPTTSTQNLTNHFGDQGISEECLSSVCNVVLDIFTLGFIDLGPTIDLSSVQDFSGQIGVNPPDPVKLHQIKVDPSVVANFNQKESGDISEVHITPSGITAGLVGHFASLAVDPSVPPTPGVTLTPAPVPALPVPNAEDVFIGISDDAINMMFASLTAAGKLQTGDPNGNGCIDTGKTVADLLPAAGCDTLTGTTDDATVAARAFCHAIEGDNCASLSFDDPTATSTQNAKYTATEQGVCYGTQGLPSGETCSSVAGGNLTLWAACNVTPNYNLRASQPLLFCAKGDVPPRMLFPDSPGTLSAVPAALRIPSLSVSLIVDRNQDHQVNGDFQSAPGCFTQGASTSADCNIFLSCLDLNLDFSMSFETCSDNKPGFVSTFKDIQVLNRQVGTVCGGATSPTSDSNVLGQSSSDTITIPLGQNGASFAPPICGVGLDLGGFVQCTNPGILSIRSENMFPESRDYLAITCNVQ